MIIVTEYDLGDIVYLKTDEDQKARMICSINIKPGLQVLYSLECGTESTIHYEIEMSKEKDLNLK